MLVDLHLGTTGTITLLYLCFLSSFIAALAVSHCRGTALSFFGSAVFPLPCTLLIGR
jgi:hypothetical protein